MLLIYDHIDGYQVMVQMTDQQQETMYLSDESATVAAGQRLGRLLAQQLEQTIECCPEGRQQKNLEQYSKASPDKGIVLFLEGQLGAGKTTFTRGVLNSFGHSAPVKSPTYTLVEPYEDFVVPIYHFDLYRLGDPEELAYMGIRDYFENRAICLIEWAERGLGFLPAPDIRVELVPQKLDSGIIGRKLIITAITDAGGDVLRHWES